MAKEMKFRFEVDGFSGYVDSLDSLRDRINVIRSKFDIEGKKLKIFRNQGPLDTVFEHRGPADKVMTV